ncbi:MAG: metal ABC transporter substrate-binding protein [Faecalibacterium sp.]|nr:metal ABC transporter substrate-binding protein [Ruminococcus sp.]MCM1393069.1 metal ABC transporter substrate-binding protein [Ruminococcus sp.]MCM1484706.1 metal ABC transporter substrate-binding protein [Faecalibacterium sp.]
MSLAPSTNYKKDEISIITTGFASYDFAKQIAAEKANVEMLLSPGEESHTFEPTPSDIIKIQDCDVFIYGGGESDEWVNNILSSIDTEKIAVVKMMESTEAEKEDIIEGMEHHEDSEDEYDEHVWTSPLKAIEIVQSISNALCKSDSVNKDFYMSQTENYIKKLKMLDESFREISFSAQDKHFIIGDRFPFKYLFDEYNFSYYAAFPGCSAESDASPATIAFLIEKVKAENINVVFKVDLSSGNVAESIAESTGTKIETLYSCHIISSDDFNAGETYISLMQRNIEVLSQAI